MPQKLHTLFNKGGKRAKPCQAADFETYSKSVLHFVSNINPDNTDLLATKYAYYLKIFPTIRLVSHSGVAAILGFDSKSTTTQYWIDRGWNESEAKSKVANRQSVMSIESIAKRENISLEDARIISKTAAAKGFVTTKRRSDYAEIQTKKGRTVENYMRRVNPRTGEHYTADEAKRAIQEHQSYASRAHWNAVAKGDKVHIAVTSLQHFLNKGMSEHDAREALHQRQATFSLKKCIERYGETEGKRRFKQRQEKWLATLDAKPDDEKQRILEAKTRRSKRYSAEAERFILKLLHAFGIDVDSPEVYFSDNEWFISYRDDKNKHRLFFYDLVIRDLKIAVEYNGSSWHARPTLSPAQLAAWTNPITRLNGFEQQKKDAFKNALAEKAGFKVFTVWDYEDHDAVIDRIIDECLNGNTK